MRKAAGFTLIELTFVLAGIGILATLAVPGYDLFVRRARLAEAYGTLEGIVHAENTYHRDHGSFVACAPSSAVVPKGDLARFDPGAAGWRELGFTVDGAVRYRYEVVLEGQTFLARAQGDLDGNGKTSSIVMRGDDFSVHAENELE